MPKKLIIILFCSLSYIAWTQDTIRAIKPHYQIDEWLMENMEWGDIEFIKLCLKGGADANTAHYRGITPIMYAAMYGRLDAANLLIKHGADVNKSRFDGKTPLMITAEQEDIEMGELFILNKADVTKKNREGHSALHISVLNHHYYFTDMLLYYEVPVDQKTSEGATALTLACFIGDVVMVKLLVNSGADLQACDKEGFTPLMAASQEGHKEIVELLLDFGVDLDMKDENGLTALCYAVKKGHQEIVEILIDKGADYNITYVNGFNLIYLADMNYHYEIKKYLTELGLKPQFNFDFYKMYVGTGFNVSAKDILYLFDIGINESRCNLYFGIVYMNRFGKTPILEINDVSINQLLEKRSFIGFDLGKKFKLHETKNISDIGISANCKGLFTYGKYEVVERKPIGHFMLSPSFGVYYHKDFFAADLQYEYLNIGIEEFPKGRITLSTHFDVSYSNHIKDKKFKQ